ncbi:hypothetical protein ACHAWC_001945 [Mediolabrus comicus]
MKSSCRNFFSCWFIASVLVLLTIFAHQSEAAIPAANVILGANQIRSATYWQAELSQRQLKQNISPLLYVNIRHQLSLARRLEATGDEDDATPSNLLHLNLQELPSLLDCQDGCKAEFALITSDQCNSTDAQDTALEFKLEEELTFDKTHITDDEDAPDNGWATKPFRELANKSTDKSTDSSAPPITLAEFVTAAAMVTEVIDAMTPDKDYNLAVYLYNNETEPYACSTLELVTEEEELQAYYALFGGGDEGEDGSDVVEGGEKPVAANGSSLLAGGMLAYAVAGVSVVLSAILFA